jgi:hypothetical protein
MIVPWPGFNYTCGGMNRLSVAFAISLLILSCEKKQSSQPPKKKPFKLDMVALANKIMERSALKKGERVLIVARPGEFDTLVTLLQDKVAALSGTYLGAISVDREAWPESWKTEFTRGTEGKGRDQLSRMFEGIDLGIMLPGPEPADIPYKAMQDALSRGKSGRTIHFHWTGAFDFSTNPAAIDSNVSKIYQQAVLKTDYERLSRTMNAFEEAIKKREVTVITGNGNKLTFKIGNRPVTKQDGDASLTRTTRARNLIDREIEIPAGAIRVAPIEETVEGTIAMPDAVWDDRKVEGLVLTFKKGKVTDINALIGAEAVKTELDRAGDAGHSFRELAVGFNPLLAIPEEKDLIPYYGYGQGVVRLSLGDNTELGGNVTGGYARISLFRDASLLIGDEVWISRGKMVRRVN